MSVIPQYLRSSADEVVAAFQRNYERRAEFNTAGLALARDFDADSFAYSKDVFTGARYVTGVRRDIQPEKGRWMRRLAPTGDVYWKPYRNNPIVGRLESIAYKPERLPGVVSSVAATTPKGLFISPATVFDAHGAVFLGFSAVPTDEEENRTDWESLWVPVSEEQFRSALESHNAALKH